MTGRHAAWSGGCLPPDQWPVPDRLAWQRACRRHDPGDPGAAGHLSPATRVRLCDEYGQFLAWMRKTERLDPAQQGADQVSGEVLDAFLVDARQARSDLSVFKTLDALSMMLRRLAPDRQWRWVCRHPNAPRPADAREARRPPRTFDAGRLLHRLLGELERLDALPTTPRSAGQRRDFLIVAVGVYTALRRRNLTDLTLGRSFIRRSETWFIRFRAQDTKMGVPILKKLPLALVPHMDRYVRTERPCLLGPRSSQALWITSRGARLAMKPSGIGDVFERVGLAMLGHPIASHQTRYTAATTLLTMDPRAMSIASALLTHADPNTVPTFYDQSGVEVAQDIWQQMRHGIIKPGGKRGR